MCGFLICEGTGESVLDAFNSMKSRGVLSGYNIHKGFFIGHQTLPIASLDEREYKQPFGYGNNKVFAGEIFNWKELNPNAQCELDAIDKGIDWNQAEGFWSYAEVFGHTLKARTDYLSQKPVYYRTDMMAIASEPYALSLLAPTRFDRSKLKNITRLDENTCWENIKKLPAGHEMVYIGGDAQTREYFNWDLVPDMKLGEALKRSLSYRVQGQREISMLLSGGLDSSLLYQMLQTMGKEVKTYTLDNDETHFAQLVNPNTNLVELEDDATDSIKAFQTPLDLGSVKPQLQMARALNSEGVNVVITGDGADELFGGYRRHADLSKDTQEEDIFKELVHYHNERLDRVMMAETIETRCPYLSAPIIKLALVIPREERTQKQWLRKLAVNYGVRQEILQRKKQPLKSDAILSKGPLEVSKENIKKFKEIF